MKLTISYWLPRWQSPARAAVAGGVPTNAHLRRRHLHDRLAAVVVVVVVLANVEVVQIPA